MGSAQSPLLIKRYASRRLYNTETSDYVTLEDIARFIREGRDVQIIDLKSGADLTRQFLLQIIAEHESRGENVLPLDVLVDLVRSYVSPTASMMPQLLQASFEMMRSGQTQFLQSLSQMPSMGKIPGFEALQAQQEAFVKAMMGGFGQENTPKDPPKPETPTSNDDLSAIKAQLAELQEKLSKL